METKKREKLSKGKQLRTGEQTNLQTENQKNKKIKKDGLTENNAFIKTQLFYLRLKDGHT